MPVGSRHSLRLTCLLTTLLFLLCIYIKRVSAAAALVNTNAIGEPCPTHLESKDLAEGIELEAPRTVLDGEVMAEIGCDLDLVVTYKGANKPSKSMEAMKEQVIKNATVCWFKDGQVLHRENGNPILWPNPNDIESDPNALDLVKVGPSDNGRYTCLISYHNVKSIPAYLETKRSLSFDVHVIEPKYRLPDQKPTISHPPADLYANRGSRVEFKCEPIVTLMSSRTLWFKSCSLSLANQTCIDKFFDAYNKTLDHRIAKFMIPFVMKNEESHVMYLNNVSSKDEGYYGCLVTNSLGFDIRRGSLTLIESLTTMSPGMVSTIPSLGSSSIVNPNIHSLPIGNQLDYNKSLNVLATTGFHQTQQNILFYIVVLVMLGIMTSGIMYIIFHMNYKPLDKKNKPNNLAQHHHVPLLNEKEVNLRQHLPSGDCPDIYSIGKTTDGFISGHLLQDNGHIMSQSICSKILEKENNPSISSNSNSDEASSWGKSVSTQGDNNRAFYLHTSNTTTTTVPMYDYPPTANQRLCVPDLVQEACIINPIYGIIRPDSDATDWSFPRKKLERLDKIGEGQFGEVWRFKVLQDNGNSSFVAVKQLKNRYGFCERERLDMIAEIEIMKSVNDHPNVIKLIAHCNDEKESALLLIMEFAEHGKLQSYLRNCRSFSNPYGLIGGANGCHSNYCDATRKEKKQFCLPHITSKELIKFSYHIAKGMEHVASRGIIHRDLASRNILLTKDKVCKVADFGFARRITDDCAYERTSTSPVPVKWMAPEALVENKFTSKSDVFSMGILMWEIVTLGATPYECMTSSEVYKKVTTGGRLVKPAHCRDEFYQIMSSCWKHNPAERPTFKEIASELETLLLSDTDYIELDQYPEHAYYNILNVAEKEVVVKPEMIY